jgi:hypothetical protein
MKMQLDLITRHVFIDTSVFRAANFSFHSSLFRSLTELARKRRLFVKITDITQYEVEAQLQVLVEESAQELNRLKTKAYILRNSEVPRVRQLFEPLDTSAIHQELLGQFQSFLLNAEVEFIFSDTVLPARVFDRYFLLRPPFGDSKKKSEFPDAFVIEALLQWCDQNDQRLFVVSSDNDLKMACETERRLIYAESLEGLIDRVIRFDAKLTEFDDLFEREASQVKNAIAESLCHANLSVKGSVSAAVTSVESVTILNRSVIGFDAQFSVMELLVDVNFSAELYFPPDEAADTAEQDDLFDSYYTEITVRQAKTIPAEVRVQFAELEPQYLYVERVILNREQPITIDLAENEGAELVEL